MIASPSRRSQGVYDASDVIKHEADTTIEWRVATHDGDRFTVPSMHIRACSWKQFRNDVMTRRCSNSDVMANLATASQRCMSRA